MSEKDPTNYNINRDDEQLKKSFAGEKAKLAQMTFSEKLEYIFSYYKYYIIAILAVLALIGYFIYHQCTYVSYKLYGIVVNSNIVDDSKEADIADYLGMEKHEGVSIIGGLSGDVDVSSGQPYNQIDIYTVAGSIDFVFTDESGAQYMCDLGTVCDMSEVLPADLYNQWKDRVTEFSVYDANTDDTYFEAPVAIDISGTNVQKYFGLTDDTCYLMICNLSGNTEYEEKFLDMLYEIETDPVMLK